MKQITLSQAKAMKFKRHDNNYNRLMAQETETKVIFDNIEVDFSQIFLTGKMVNVHGIDLINNTPLWMVIE